MTNFKDFYNNIEKEELTEDRETNDLNKPSVTGSSISRNIATNISQIIVSTVGVLSIFSNQEKVEKFSKEVANYATSDDVISSLSEQIGTPRENETEQEFVERASNVLREILKKKFNI